MQHLCTPLLRPSSLVQLPGGCIPIAGKLLIAEDYPIYTPPHFLRCFVEKKKKSENKRCGHLWGTNAWHGIIAHLPCRQQMCSSRPCALNGR